MEDQTTDYWHGGSWLEHQRSQCWRTHADRINTRLLERWFGAPGLKPHGSVLKTDLYDEAFGRGQIPWLSAQFSDVRGIDICANVAAQASTKYIQLNTLVADVRHLPYADNSVDAVVSLSTLDHFKDANDITRSLAEISRVLIPGGRLILTLDNPANPVIWLRQSLPQKLLRRTGLVPYYCGATVHPRELTAVVKNAGLLSEEMTTLIHAPRVLAIPVARLLDSLSLDKYCKRFIRILDYFESLEQLPTSFRTGYFVAVLCRKPG